MIQTSTTSVLENINQKTKDPSKAEKAEIWLGKAVTINDKSNALFEFIEKLKLLCNKENPEIGKINSDELYKRLKNFRQDLLNTDYRMKAEFANKLWVFGKEFERNNKDENEFEKSNFTTKIFTKTKVMLSKFQNGVKLLQSELIRFCDYQCTPGCNLAFNQINSIVAANRTHLKANEEIMITAGLGFFSTASKAKFTINGINVESAERGYVKYKVKVGDTKGQHKIPVIIEYTDQTGRLDSLIDYVEYTVDQ